MVQLHPLTPIFRVDPVGEQHSPKDLTLDQLGSEFMKWPLFAFALAVVVFVQHNWLEIAKIQDKRIILLEKRIGEVEDRLLGVVPVPTKTAWNPERMLIEISDGTTNIVFKENHFFPTNGYTHRMLQPQSQDKDQ